MTDKRYVSIKVRVESFRQLKNLAHVKGKKLIDLLAELIAKAK